MQPGTRRCQTQNTSAIVHLGHDIETGVDMLLLFVIHWLARVNLGFLRLEVEVETKRVRMSEHNLPLVELRAVVPTGVTNSPPQFYCTCTWHLHAADDWLALTGSTPFYKDKSPTIYDKNCVQFNQEARHRSAISTASSPGCWQTARRRCCHRRHCWVRKRSS